MSAPLISDATLAKIVRLAAPQFGGPLACILEHAADGRLVDALALARDACPIPSLIAAIEEANEEAARTYDDRERERYVLTHPDAKVDAVVDEKDPTMVHVTISAPSPTISRAVIPIDPPVAEDARTNACELVRDLEDLIGGRLATAKEIEAARERNRALTTVIVNERAGQRHETTVFPDGCVDTKVTAYCAGCARGDGVADHTCEAAERAREMVVPHPNCSPDEPAAVKIWRARAAILQEERDAARAELIATKKKLQGVMYGGGKRRRK